MYILWSRPPAAGPTPVLPGSLPNLPDQAVLMDSEMRKWLLHLTSESWYFSFLMMNEGLNRFIKLLMVVTQIFPISNNMLAIYMRRLPLQGKVYTFPNHAY